MIYRDFAAGMVRIPQQIAEMHEACRFLYHMRNHSPVIAGGALWSWAAGKRPNDIDVFVANSPGLVESLGIAFEPNPGSSDSLEDNPRTQSNFYRGFHPDDGKPYVIHRFKYQLTIGIETQAAGGSYAVPVDLVVTPWRQERVISHFDYNHCRVAFGATVVKREGKDERIELHADSFGAQWYERGILMTTHSRPRSKERIMSKIQADLWGNPEAGERLRMVFEALDHTYKTLYRNMQEIGNRAVLA